MKMLTYAITGANGQLGSYLVSYLRKNGHIVYELTRSPEKAQDKNYYKYFDLANPRKISSLQNIDVLIHAAYFFDATNKEYSTINILGTQKLFQQAKTDNVKYPIFISTISAYETARSLYGQTKYKIEKLLKLENENVTIIRPGLIFHTPLQGITAAMDNFIKKYPVVPLIGCGKQLINPCRLEELAPVLYNISIYQPFVKHPIVAASEQSMTFKELVKYLAGKRNKKIKLISIPFFMIYLMLKVTELLKLPIGLRSDSLLGLQYANSNLDFSETRNLNFNFSELSVDR